MFYIVSFSTLVRLTLQHHLVRGVGHDVIKILNFSAIQCNLTVA